MNIQEASQFIKSQNDMTIEDMANLMTGIFSGECTEDQIILFLEELTLKGESISELIGAVKAMRNFSVKVKAPFSDLIDCCGTGGLGKSMMNVSTTSALVAAACDVKVAKHGNRSATGTSGSADLLEAAGVNLDLSPEAISKCIEKIGMGFMFAQNHHPGMKFVMSARKKIGKKTIFNLLGPLTNPADASKQAIGVFDSKWVIPIAEVLQKLGTERALIFHSYDGLDEISIADKTYMAELRNNKISELEIDPKQFDLSYKNLDALKVESPSESYEKVQETLKGSFDEGEAIVKLNAAAVIYTSGMKKSIEEGFLLAEEVIKSGRGFQKLKDLISFSNESVKQ
ncbi:anthranilate phosphoribosyltransferase [SAR86 cluster bacterium]|nr:anthranilate phosphoribosyltransferase [SAR86 cluster bacterium]